MSIREQMHSLADQIAEDATWDDVAYEIYVRQAVENGLRASREGRLIPADQAKAYLNRLRNRHEGTLDDRRA